ncbi:FusB/FusC family EF-G-binding protein [Paenibacillus sp. N3.4]|uniref:FusB/FusC family EF-G-binding protein n=1 Tax=Paenibacillus sp. N3.4 TaxID=2603222 RepID=UPI0011CC304E|nr:FusB/FusC family EF-G-binding protein [Paenibacillus sp. N3.4]TXK85019.1 elongation factor G-binding protein [Paenibacillus sp. N3.4]
MIQPFINNHQFNFIHKQVGLLKNSSNDQKVMDAVRYSIETKVIQQFSQISDMNKQMLQKVSTLEKVDEFQDYLDQIESHLIEFPRVTESQLKKLFPKIKKLKLPELEVIDYQHLTYLGWIDISSNKFFIVYNYAGKMVGIEGKYTLTNKKGICALCNGHGEIALVTAMTKSRPANSPDYYKSVGNYMCIDSHKCNKNITDVTYLERFIQDVIG